MDHSKKRVCEKMRLLKKLNNKSGIILIIVLWTLVILSMLAVSLGRKTSIELSLAKYAIAKFKAKQIAFAGLIYSISQINKEKLKR